MSLVIVESPTKARKLAEYLGSKYTVMASVGHVRDLPKSELGIDIDHDFEPTYVVDAGKRDVVKKLRDLAERNEVVYLATDPDREGEAIAWHVQYLLTNQAGSKSKSHDPKFYRAVFHEITKQAVQSAIANPIQLNQDLVNAQQARRVVDRLVGYQVSPVLWRKVRRGLSAGRVQSVALRLIVEREREIQAFVPEEYWELDVLLSLNGGQLGISVSGDPLTKPAWLDNPPADTLVARVIKIDEKNFEPQSAAMAEPVLRWLPEAQYQVSSIERKRRERVSLPPFTTSTLQQAAANRLGFTSKQTMSLAQQLYEEGLITYHRTDAVALSQSAIEMARAHIAHHYGSEYVPVQPRRFSTKSKNAQEAHEAIRVTDVKISANAVAGRGAKLGDRHAKLYDLIWRRFVASQMAASVSDQTTILIEARGGAADGQPSSAQLKATGSVMTFDGWTKLFPASDDRLLPAVQDNQALQYQVHHGAQKFTQPPARYNDASLVKELEKRGIGRPSTYASIISVLVDRGYVERLEKRFVPTAVGMAVADFLLQHFRVFMEYDFTAEMEEDLDRIARGEREWHKVVKTFYQPLAQIIAQVTKQAERVQIPVEETGESCPTCGATEGGRVVIRSGRFGKFRSCNRFPECDYTENIVEKVADQKCPLCQKGEVIIKPSRWGKSFFGCSRYPECKWASWKKPEPGLVITEAEWADMQAEREAKKAAKLAKSGGKPASKTAGRSKSSAKKTPKKSPRSKSTKAAKA